MISISHLRKEYETVTPLEDVSVEIQKGDVISIIGPSGTGKSTFLRCLNLLERPTSGTIVVDGMDITDPKFSVDKLHQRMGMVFQSFNLFNHMNVIENIMYAPIKVLKITKEDAYNRGMELLKKVGLADKELAYPDELSGGQKQRVAIARALAMDPEILLFDEPTSALDPTMVAEVLMVIRELANQGLTILIVTHQMRFARNVSTRIFYMDEGGIYEQGTPEEIFEHPQKEKTRQFIRQLKTYEKEIKKDQFDLPAFTSELMTFAHRHMMPHKVTYALQSIIEELILVTMLPYLNESLLFTLEYSEEKEQADIILKWKGKEWNPIDGMDELAKKIFNSMNESIQYEYEQLENKLRIHVKGA